MIENFSKIHDLLNDSQTNFIKNNLKDIVQNYNYLLSSEFTNIQEKEKQIFIENIKKSKVIIIDQKQLPNDGTKKKYLFFGFEKTLIIHEHVSSSSSASFINYLLSFNRDISVCYLSNTKNLIKKTMKIENPEIESDATFQKEINSFCNNLYYYNIQNPQNIIWPLITPCISAYLIKKSYLQREKYRIQKFIQDIEKETKPEVIREDEYIELRNVGEGSMFICTLIYHIKRGELYVIKKPSRVGE